MKGQGIMVNRVVGDHILIIKPCLMHGFLSEGIFRINIEKITKMHRKFTVC